jgi:outer membrane protein assembly factor BamB
MALLPNGNLVLLLTSGDVPRLTLYDPANRKVLQAWTETHKYPSTETYVDNTSKEVQRIAVLRDGPVPSRDGSRLFAMSEGDVILWDSSTLEELDRFDAPEVARGTEGCFYPAPDGRGMWFLGQSGKVYRLDDHTGKLLEEVKLPFHLISLIREP